MPVPVVVVSSVQSRTDTPVTATCFESPTTALASEGLASAIHTDPPAVGVAVTTTSASTRLSTSGPISTGSAVAGCTVNSRGARGAQLGGEPDARRR